MWYWASQSLDKSTLKIITKSKKHFLFKICFFNNLMITFILPLSTYRDINIAINILFPSIYQFFDCNQLQKTLVLLNKKDFDIFNIILSNSKIKYNKILKIELVDECVLYSKKALNTYYLQMLLKLLSSKLVKTEYYLTLDADNIFTKISICNNFFINDKAYCTTIDKKDKWLSRVEYQLDVKLKFNINQTPFVFKKNIVEKMLNELSVPDLILVKNCSEYTLYLGYMIKNNLFYSNYENKNFTAPIINNSTIHHDFEDVEVKINEAFLVNDDQVITCIQSRTNILDKYIDIIYNYIKNIKYTKFKIGVITVISNDNYYERYKEPLFIKKDYCKYHNYDFIIKILDNCNGWDKLKLLKEKLNDDYDYILTSDADVVITNRDKSIEELILKYFDNNFFMLISKDLNSLNSGNIIWKNCIETKIFLDKVLKTTNNIRYTLNEPFKSIGIYEQPSLIYIINKEYEYYKDKIKLIPQYEINSYLPIICNTTEERGYWKINDFLIHFAGFNYSKDEEKRNKMNLDNIIKKFCYIYKIKIIQKEGNDYGNIK